MTRIPGSTPGAPAGAGSPDERLRATTKQLEGVFVQELFKAMRETVPKDGFTDGGAGEDIFTGLMDEKIAAQLPEHWERGMGDSLYRQLRAALPLANPDAAPSGADDKRIK
jgi:peptidoglycan hydrolase FlgJ